MPSSYEYQTGSASGPRPGSSTARMPTCTSARNASRSALVMCPLAMAAFSRPRLPSPLVTPPRFDYDENVAQGLMSGHEAAAGGLVGYLGIRHTDIGPGT